MNNKNGFIIFFLIVLITTIAFYVVTKEKPNDLSDSGKKELNNETSILVENPEVYELANIILALTKYGKEDNNQVKKNNTYYNKMINYFEPFKNHPVIDSTNFSKERWKEFLSFRTDAIAFKFDKNNRLKRENDFQSFEIKTFDEHLDLVQNFADKSNYRQFYKNNKSYYENILKAYKNEYMLEEMQQFLDNEFGALFKEETYKVILSSFVGGQNLHRDIDSQTPADFVDVPNAILYDTITSTKKELSIAIHTLFTEMDHGYINPTSNLYSKEIQQKFNDSIWNNESGYDENKNGVFNEYMTWAVYDIFNEKYFPEYAEVNLNYHYINANRGLPYSNIFSKKLEQLYKGKKIDETLKNLYPEILDWCYQIQKGLSFPEIVIPKKTIEIKPNALNSLNIEFSEPMEKARKFDLIFADDYGNSDIISINENISWNKKGTQVAFNIDLNNKDFTSATFNYWDVKSPFLSLKGVLLKPTYLKFESK